MARPAQPGQYEGPLPGGRRRCDGVAMQILAGLAITLGFDICFDVAIYYLLHWLANHWQAFPWVKHRKPHRAGMSFISEGQKLSYDIVADDRSGKSAAENLQAA